MIKSATDASPMTSETLPYPCLLRYANNGYAQTIFDHVWDVLPEEMIDIVETFDDVCE